MNLENKWRLISRFSILMNSIFMILILVRTYFKITNYHNDLRSEGPIFIDIRPPSFLEAESFLVAVFCIAIVLWNYFACGNWKGASGEPKKTNAFPNLKTISGITIFLLWPISSALLIALYFALESERKMDLLYMKGSGHEMHFQPEPIYSAGLIFGVGGLLLAIWKTFTLNRPRTRSAGRCRP